MNLRLASLALAVGVLAGCNVTNYVTGNNLKGADTINANADIQANGNTANVSGQQPGGQPGQPGPGQPGQMQPGQPGPGQPGQMQPGQPGPGGPVQFVEKEFTTKPFAEADYPVTVKFKVPGKEQIVAELTFASASDKRIGKVPANAPHELVVIVKGKEPVVQKKDFVVPGGEPKSIVLPVPALPGGEPAPTPTPSATPSTEASPAT